MIYGIANKNSVTICAFSDTTDSIYPVETFKIFRKFATRKAARTYKQRLKNPQAYAIINTRSQMIVR